MKYFSIEFSLNEKIVGKIPQLKEVKYNCNIEDARFIDQFPFQKIKIEPILATAVLYAKSKQTDLIENGGTGFSYASVVISEKLKKILSEFNCYGVQFFPTKIIQKDVFYTNYWQTHFYKIPFEYVDLNKTKILLKDRDKNRNISSKFFKISSIEHFLRLAKSLKYPKRIIFKDVKFLNTLNYDYFTLKHLENSTRGIVSERLKNRIEKEGCTGIEFKPIELNLSEWMKRDGPRDSIYGRSW